MSWPTRSRALRPYAAASGGLALLVTVLLAGSALSQQPNERRRLVVGSHGATVDATLGSYCLTQAQPGGGRLRECATAATPLPLSGRVPTHPGDRILLRQEVAATSVLVTTSDARSRPASSTIPATAVDADRRIWAYEVPADLPSTADRLTVFVRYPNGDDTAWEAGLAWHRHGIDPRRQISVRAGRDRLRPRLRRACLRAHWSAPPRCRRATRGSRVTAAITLEPGGRFRIKTPTTPVGAGVVLARRATTGETIVEPTTLTGQVDQRGKTWSFTVPTRIPRSGSARFRIRYGDDEFAEFVSAFRRGSRR